MTATPKTVYVYAPGDMDGGQFLEVSSVSTAAHQITFTSPHGIVAIAGATVWGHIVGDVWEPPEPHKNYGYIDRILVI